MHSVIYHGPRYLNVSATRKQYIIEIGEVEWEYDVDGFENKFIYETVLNPFEDDGDMMYGVNGEFYSELAETLATNVCEFRNEPEIISIFEII